MPKVEEEVELTIERQELSEREILLSARSEEVQEIVGRMPSWIIRYGISLLALIIGSVFIASYFIQYPDTVPSRVLIISSQPPVKIVSQANGNIQKLFVSNRQTVTVNEPLYLIENSADYTALQSIINDLHRADSFIDVDKIAGYIPIKALKNLGELQQAYNQLQLATSNYLFFARLKNDKNRIQHLRQQIAYYQRLNQHIQNQGGKLDEQRRIAQKGFTIDSSLVVVGVMTELEYRDARTRLLNQEIISGNTQTQRIQNQLQQSELRKAITETKQEREIRLFELGKQVKEQLQSFISQYQRWEKKYMVKSPIAGVVSFFSIWKENQFVQAGQGIMMVTPKIRDIQVKGLVGLSGAGKVEKGQKVLVKLRAYPYQEFGMLKGEISSLSPVAMDSVYAIDILLPKGLITESGKKIPEKAQLMGMGEIITSDKSVFERLFEKVKLQMN